MKRRPGYVALALAAFLSVTSTEAIGKGDPPGDQLPVCRIAPWAGFATPEEAAAAPDDAPVCVTPRDQIEVQKGRPLHAGPPADSAVPTGTGYHHNGAQTNARYKGGQATIEVTDPKVTHDGSVNEFVVSRVMGKKWADSNWLEAGWAEVSWRSDTPVVYTYTDAVGSWNFHTGYSLTRGSYYKFRVERCSVDGVYRTCAYIYWNGSWQRLDVTSYGCTYDGTDDNRRCYIEEYTEVYSQDSSPHPALTDNDASIDWDDTKIRDGANWVTWNDNTYPSGEGSIDPYSACWTNKDWDFRVKRGAC